MCVCVCEKERECMCKRSEVELVLSHDQLSYVGFNKGKPAPVTVMPEYLFL